MTPDLARVLTDADKTALMQAAHRADATGCSCEAVFDTAEQVIRERTAQALYEARDALYRGEGPDAYADADILYGEWLGNRADRLTRPVPSADTEATS